jgi:hypothetical protein
MKEQLQKYPNGRSHPTNTEISSKQVSLSIDTRNVTENLGPEG